MARTKRERDIIATAARGQLDAFIRSKGLRHTPERYAILDHALKFDKLFSVDMLLGTMENDVFRVCKATVYNTVQLLCDADILRKHSYAANHVLYEVAINPKGNIHLVCRCCGNVKVVDDAEVDALLRHRHFMGFAHRFYSLYVYGLCTQCKRATLKK